MNFENFELIKQGAEAKLYKGVYLGKKVIVKRRFTKKYRHPTIDEQISKDRLKAEARALLRCKSVGIHTPTVYLVDFEDKSIILENIENSFTVKDYIEQQTEHRTTLMQMIGHDIAKMHRDSIIHGDLTTSNILVSLNDSKGIDKLYFIDFGLSQVSQSSEDKAVDLYVLERAILSTHADSETLCSDILDSYFKSYGKGSGEVKNKFEEVRARGRKRTMVG